MPRHILKFLAVLLSTGSAASQRDSLFVYERGWMGGYGFLLVSESKRLDQFIEFEAGEPGNSAKYYQRKIENNIKADSVLNGINKTGYRKIKDQDELPNDSSRIADGHTVYIRLKSKQKNVELAYDNPERHPRHEDSIVSGLWRAAWYIRDSCLAPISENRETDK